MGIFLLRQLLIALLSLWGASVVIFALLRVMPADPADIILGMNATADTAHALRQQLGLNQPLLSQYIQWVGGMVMGDFGTSYTYNVPVADLIIERLSVSLPLAVLTLFLSTTLALPLGIISAYRTGSPTDYSIMGITQVGIALPNFWVAVLLIMVFAIHLQWLPAGGFAGWNGGIGAGVQSLILPACALAIPQACILARIVRTALLDVMGSDYIRTAYAKGLPPRLVLWRHAMRGALIAVLTVLGLQFSFLIAGAIIIENIFYLPGLGRLVFQAISNRDLIVVQGVVMVLVCAVIVVNMAIGMLYGSVDPRIKTGEKHRG